MNTQDFIAAYNESRNGADHFVRHPLVKSFHYSDGVQSLAQAGCYWLLDMLATEIRRKDFIAKDAYLCVVSITVKDGIGIIEGKFADDDPAPYRKRVNTDLPDGEWQLYLSDDGDGVIRCILPTEY